MRQLHRVWIGRALACAVLLLSARSGAQELRLGHELQVNTYTPGNQASPASAATDADGDFVLTWQSHYQDGSAFGIFARRFSSAGSPLTGEIQVNSYTVLAQSQSTVASDGNGDFVVVWEDSNASDSDGLAVFGRRFASNGAPLTGQFPINTYTNSDQAHASVAPQPGGAFVAVWHSKLQDASTYGVFARRFTSAGAVLATEFRVNSYTPGYQNSPVVAANAAGDFLVVWASVQDGASFGTFGRLFSSAGAPQAIEFQVNAYTQSQQRHASVATAAGNFVVVWDSYHQDGSYYGVFGRHVSSTGVALASEFRVNSYTVEQQRYGSVSADTDGDFVVAWLSAAQDGASGGIFARRFSSAGAPLAIEFRVNTYTLNHQFTPSVVVLPGGDFVIAWGSSSQDGSGDGFFAQRFGGPITLDVDGNGTTEALTDGLLVLRFLFGFTGNTLISGAVGGGCSRCEASEISLYLAGLGLILDVNDDTMTDAVTDGLLSLRYLFGFTGTALTTGAVGDDCNRCDSATILPYLIGLDG